MSSLVSLK
ncbi:hypothetical protein N7479_001052 [Penicillium vulpinum]|nr:hypothetical protein N7479_001052 [Penicillium vulpinum]